MAINPAVLVVVRTVLPYVLAFATTSQMTPQIQESVERNIMENLSVEGMSRPWWFQALTGGGLLVPRIIWGAVKPIVKPIGRALGNKITSP